MPRPAIIPNDDPQPLHSAWTPGYEISYNGSIIPLDGADNAVMRVFPKGETTPARTRSTESVGEYSFVTNGSDGQVRFIWDEDEVATDFYAGVWTIEVWAITGDKERLIAEGEITFYENAGGALS